MRFTSKVSFSKDERILNNPLSTSSFFSETARGGYIWEEKKS